MTPMAHDDSTSNNGSDEAETPCNDLILRDGFPALFRPGTQWLPNIDDTEPIPKHKIWASNTALSFHDNWEQIVADCCTVFTARTRDNDQNYSAGTTYFLPSVMKPRCALEGLVRSIFDKHTSTLAPTTFRPEQSGTEWWTLVLDDDDNEDSSNSKGNVSADSGADSNGRSNEDDDDDEEESDEVGWHFDADYGLEAQAPNLLLHPRLATVTYLTEYGAPTVVLDKQSPSPQDMNKASLNGSVSTAWLSCPRVGKHLAFDGRLLHGAPASIFPSKETQSSSTTEQKPPASPHREPETKRIKLAVEESRGNGKRVTLLANVWLNHCPLDAEPLDDDVLEELRTPWSDSVTTSEAPPPPFTWNDTQLDLDASASCRKIGLTSADASESAAGTEEVALCGRLVTFSYGAARDNFHEAAILAGTITEDLLELELGPRVISIHVGDELPSDESDDDDEDEVDNEGVIDDPK